MVAPRGEQHSDLIIALIMIAVTIVVTRDPNPRTVYIIYIVYNIWYSSVHWPQALISLNQRRANKQQQKQQ